MAKPYQRDMDFAFFAANFGYSKADYDALTPREINFLYKAWENRVIADSYHLYNAVFTAVYNGHRPKRKRALKPVEKRSPHKGNRGVGPENPTIIRDGGKKEGEGWGRDI